MCCHESHKEQNNRSKLHAEYGRLQSDVDLGITILIAEIEGR